MKKVNSIADVLRYTRENWTSSFGLLLAIIVYLTIIIALISSVELSHTLSFAAIALGILLITAFWIYARRIPRNKNNSIGFAVALAYGDDVEGPRVRQDFIETLHRCISTGSTGRLFNYLVIPTYAANKIVVVDDAIRIRDKCRAHFMLYGNVRKRMLDGKLCHFLMLNGIVKHRRIDDVLKNKLSKEFGELWPNRVAIPEENDLLAFEFTSEWTEIVAKYIIGIASYVSGAPNGAELLYNDIASRLQSMDREHPAYMKISDRLPHRLQEVYQAQSAICTSKWERDHSPAHIDTLGDIMDKYEHNGVYDYGYYLGKSLYLFLGSRDVDAAISVLTDCPGKREATWHYNMAFLHAYKGDLDEAYREYKKASRSHEPKGMILRIESFLTWTLQQEPTMYQLYFALGFINLRIKDDPVSAKRDLEMFVRERKSGEYPSQFKYASKWLSKLE